MEKICDKIRSMLRRPDTTTVQEPVKADIEALQEPGQPFDEVKEN